MENNIRRKSIGPADASVVLSDALRPDWRQRKQKAEMERALRQQRLERNQNRLRHLQLFE